MAYVPKELHPSDLDWFVNFQKLSENNKAIESGKQLEIIFA